MNPLILENPITSAFLIVSMIKPGLSREKKDLRNNNNQQRSDQVGDMSETIGANSYQLHLVKSFTILENLVA